VVDSPRLFAQRDIVKALAAEKAGTDAHRGADVKTELAAKA
jgi:hypothetical protein